LDGCEFKGRFVGHDPFPLERGATIAGGGSAVPSFCCLYRLLTLRHFRQRIAMPDFGHRCLLLLVGEVCTPVVSTSTNAQIDQMIWTDHYNDLSILCWRRDAVYQSSINRQLSWVG
jgi:hypothetical protein